MPRAFWMLMSAPVPPRSASPPRFDITSGLIACVLVWIVFAPFASLDTDPYHDGVMLKPAMDVAAGQTLFRDTMMWYGGLTTWLQSAELILFGRTLRVLRFGAVCVYSLIAAGLMVCWRLILPRTLAIVAFVLWLSLSPLEFSVEPWSSVYALCFQVMTVLALMRAVTSANGRGWPLATGILAGLTFVTRHLPMGAFTCAGVLAAFVSIGVLFPALRRRAIEGVVNAAAGMLSVVVIFVISLWWQGSLDAWWQQDIVWTLGQALHTGGTFRALDYWWRDGLRFCAIAAALLLLVRTGRIMSAAVALALAAIYALGGWFDPQTTAWGTPAVALVLAFASTVWVALRTRSAPSADSLMALAALIVCVGSWIEASPTGHPGHVFWAFSVSLGFSVYAAWRLGGRRTALVAALLVLLWMPFAVHKVVLLRQRLAMPRVVLTEPPLLAGMRELPANAADWTALADAMREYSRRRPRWALLLEGKNNVALAMAPDLTNGDPRFYCDPLLPYDGARRAQFILDQRPLVFRQYTPGEPVRRALEQVGYVSLLKLRSGELLAPPDVPADVNP